jgi:murein L,D-transpeptidase YafK
LETLKQGYDFFEKYRVPPNVIVCERRYIVGVVAQSRSDPAVAFPAFSKQVVSPFKPLPEPAEMDIAKGNKLKGIANPDVEPTLADIKTAKQRQSAQSFPGSPLANAN